MTLDTTDTILNSVRGQRDRFVAFAFAAADLLVEVTHEGLVAFVAGAAQNIFRRDTDTLIGTPFLDLMAPSDRGIAKALIASIERGGRFVPVYLRLSPDAGDQQVVFGGRLRAGDQRQAKNVGARLISESRQRYRRVT